MLGAGTVGTAIVVDDETVVCWVFGGIIFRGSTTEISRRMGLLIQRVSFFVWRFEAADEELARERNVNTHVAVHGVF